MSTAAKKTQAAKKPSTSKAAAKPQRGTAGEMQSTKHIKMHVLDKEVQLACKPGEEQDLKQAVAYIDKTMRALRTRNASSSTEKIAIVTAINTAGELLKIRNQSVDNTDVTDRIASVNAKLNELLGDTST